ncbi:hypothetical protein FACS1894137_02250 [Spirochaetia bacterium]|nr:hypothetical protein FACS1894137_02250 [Spirochaetia bacterium]
MKGHSDWLKGSRAKKLKKAKLWVSVLRVKGSEWGIDALAVTEPFAALTIRADTALGEVSDKSTRTHLAVVHCREVFKELDKRMRFIKNNFFQSPPRTPEDLALVELAERKEAEAVADPKNTVTVSAVALSPHLLEARVKINVVKGQDRDASDFGIRLYALIVDPAKAGTEGRYGKYEAAAPLTGVDFSWSVYTQNSRVAFDFDERDRGKAVWFIARLESAHGGKGGWGPLFWTIIP